MPYSLSHSFVPCTCNGSARWNTQINTSHHGRWVQTPPEWSWSSPALPFLRSCCPQERKDCSSSQWGTWKGKIQWVAKDLRLFQKPGATPDTKPPVPFMEERAQRLLGTELIQASSGVNLFRTGGGDRPDSTVPVANTEYYCIWSWKALSKRALCFHKQHFTKPNPCRRKKQELLTWENVTFSVLGGTETAAKVPRLPDNYVIG